MGGMTGMGGAGALATATENIFYVKPEKDKGQYKVLPLMLSVLVDQDHVQDFLVELENSPMSIQVMDFELQRPSARVVKPEKGTMANFAGYGEQMMGGMMRGRMGGMGMMAGYGGMASGYGAMMMQMRGQYGGRGTMGMGGGPAVQARKGTDKRSTNRGKTREEETKKVEAAKGPALFDPYYDIVEVKVYGQARLYNPPPADAEVLPSLGETAATAAASGEAAKGDAPGGEPVAKAESAQAEPPKAEPLQAKPAKAESAKTEPAKAEPAKAEPAKEAKTSPETPKT